VACFLDVDPNKIGKPYCNGRLKGSKPVPVLHWRSEAARKILPSPSKLQHFTFFFFYKQLGVVDLYVSWVVPSLLGASACPEGLPVVLCVAMGRTDGKFEANVAALAQDRGYTETVHYWHFN